jgi:hypothetical protein
MSRKKRFRGAAMERISPPKNATENNNANVERRTDPASTQPNVQCRGVARPFFAKQRACNRKRFEYKNAARSARHANIVARRERRVRFGGTTSDPLSANPQSFRDTALCDVMHYFDTRLRQWDDNRDKTISEYDHETRNAYRCKVMERWGLFCCKNHEIIRDAEANAEVNATHTDKDKAVHHEGVRRVSTRGLLTDYFNAKPTGHEIHRSLIRECRRDVWGESVHEPSNTICVDAQSLEIQFIEGTCRRCRTPEMTRTRFEWVCGMCGDTTAYADAKDRHFKETDQCNPPSTGYERKNHLNEWLARIQAAERKMIPHAVIEGIQAKFTRWGVAPAKATYRTVRQFLKDDGHQTYFEHIPQIICFLTQTKPDPIKEETLVRIRSIFRDLQGPFDAHKPRGRKNFLSYSFVLFKIFELLDLDKYLPYFPMLKSRTNLIKVDILWKRLCSDCNYEFIPTV